MGFRGLDLRLGYDTLIICCYNDIAAIGSISNRSMHTTCSQSYLFSIVRKYWIKILDYYLCIRAKIPAAKLRVLFPHPLCSYLWKTSPLIHLNHSYLLPGSGAPKPMACGRGPRGIRVVVGATSTSYPTPTHCIPDFHLNDRIRIYVINLHWQREQKFAPGKAIGTRRERKMRTGKGEWVGRRGGGRQLGKWCAFGIIVVAEVMALSSSRENGQRESA